MFIGLFLVLMGVLILIYPRVIVLMIGMFLIGMGVSVMALSWRFRRLKRQASPGWMQWMMRW